MVEKQEGTQTPDTTGRSVERPLPMLTSGKIVLEPLPVKAIINFTVSSIL